MSGRPRRLVQRQVSEIRARSTPGAAGTPCSHSRWLAPPITSRSPSPGVSTMSSACGACRHPPDGHTALGPGSQDERPAGAQHDDRDQRLVEPLHLAVAVEPLEVLTVAVQQRGDTVEPGRGTATPGAARSGAARCARRCGRRRRAASPARTCRTAAPRSAPTPTTPCSSANTSPASRTKPDTYSTHDDGASSIRCTGARRSMRRSNCGFVGCGHVPSIDAATARGRAGTRRACPSGGASPAWPRGTCR